ncbi:MAG: ATP phosphoribosyltransferase regulatory subunit [Micavibrio aeruginosavorus]|uniref:Histidine--tRNA ligase n=1 Tax=Micavibrio aeruginosavorus TaxID=349221 RepID=A0A2W5HJQ7_9BACT|nr:MAG: ATP phosphoribosyltransferase regulatory subunit [Micavibrio aeruginosavorus]
MADSNALLPNGMMDNMPDDAEREAAACEKLRTIFARFGYRLVNPPLLEFEETLLAEGAGQALSTNTFRLMDPISQRMMALRSDTTAQIARITSSRLKDTVRPLRLSYITDVLRIRSTQLRPERQFRQAGCEIVGPLSTAATEIALMALISLHECGVKNISIDFTAPEILKILAAGQKQDEIIKASQRRDRAVFSKLGNIGKILIVLDEMSGPATEFITKKKNLKLPSTVTKILDQLEFVIKDLQKALKAYGVENNVTITVDALEARGFEYQSFPCFTLFAKGIMGELGRGGSYMSQFGQDKEMACGFTLYMDSVLRALPKKTRKKMVAVSEIVGWSEIQELQEKGWNVIRSSVKDFKKKNFVSYVTHIYQNGKLEEIK